MSTSKSFHDELSDIYKIFCEGGFGPQDWYAELKRAEYKTLRKSFVFGVFHHCKAHASLFEEET